jgi:hypothetical protein
MRLMQPAEVTWQVEILKQLGLAGLVIFVLCGAVATLSTALVVLWRDYKTVNREWREDLKANANKLEGLVREVKDAMVKCDEPPPSDNDHES